MLEQRPCLIRFEVRAFEDRAASREAGRYIAVDRDVVLVTSPGGNTTFEDMALPWLEKKERAGDPFVKHYREHYEAWKQGQEAPIHGTAIKNIGLFSPAEIQNCAALNVKTVEDLAAANEQTIQKLGMGGRSLVDRAKGYLDSAEGGKVAGQIEELKAKLAALETALGDKNEKIAELEEVVKKGKAA